MTGFYFPQKGEYFDISYEWTSLAHPASLWCMLNKHNSDAHFHRLLQALKWILSPYYSSWHTANIKKKKQQRNFSSIILVKVFKLFYNVKLMLREVRNLERLACSQKNYWKQKWHLKPDVSNLQPVFLTIIYLHWFIHSIFSFLWAALWFYLSF